MLFNFTPSGKVACKFPPACGPLINSVIALLAIPSSAATALVSAIKKGLFFRDRLTLLIMACVGKVK